MNAMVFVSHSAQGVERHRQLRQCVIAQLQTRGYRVFIDDDDLSPGDVWRPKIYRALAECDAAILLLSPEALRSKWVHTESTILTWRAELRASFNRPFTLIPVLLSGAERRRLRDPAAEGELPFDHLRIADNQAILEPFDAAADIAEVAASLVSQFPANAMPENDPMTEWAMTVSSLLRHVDKYFLSEVARVLGLPEDDWLSDYDRLTLATALLFADARSAVVEHGLKSVFDDTELALITLVKDHNSLDKRDLAHKILPGTIPYVATAGVISALRQECGRRVALVDVATGETTKRIIERATCCNAKVYIELPPAAQTFEEAYAEVLVKIGLRAGFYPDAIEPGALDGVDDFHIVICLERHEDGFSGNVIDKLVKQLTADFGSILVVIATGRHGNDYLAEKLHDVAVTETTIDLDLEKAMNRAIRRLEYNHLGGDSSMGKLR